MTITITCGVCGAILVEASGPQLTQDDVNNYQQNSACNTDGQTNIEVTTS